MHADSSISAEHVSDMHMHRVLSDLMEHHILLHASCKRQLQQITAADVTAIGVASKEHAHMQCQLYCRLFGPSCNVTREKCMSEGESLSVHECYG